MQDEHRLFDAYIGFIISLSSYCHIVIKYKLNDNKMKQVMKLKHNTITYAV